MTDDEVEPLALVANELRRRIRTQTPDQIDEWLMQEVPSHQQRHSLLYVLAAAVPAEPGWSELTAWIGQRGRRKAA